jgi:tetratricopeptide (TPR) repeat protein
MFQDVLARDPNNGDWNREEYLVEERIGLLSGHPNFFNLGDRKAAAKWAAKHLEDETKLLNADPTDRRARLGVSGATAELAGVYAESDPVRAEKLYMRALKVSAAVLKSDPDDSELLSHDSSERIGLACILARLGKRKQAADQWEHAIGVLQTLQKGDPEDLSIPQLMGVAFCRRASTFSRRGKLQKAQQDLQRSKQILVSLFQQHPNNLMILRDLADCYRARGNLAAQQANWPQALREYQKSLDLWEKWLQIGKTSAFDQEQRHLAASLVHNAAQHFQL